MKTKRLKQGARGWTPFWIAEDKYWDYGGSGIVSLYLKRGEEDNLRLAPKQINDMSVGDVWCWIEQEWAYWQGLG